MTISVDFNNPIVIDRGHVFLTLDDNIKESLGVWPEILDRVENSLDFIRRIDGEDKDRLRCGLIRAALAELVSIEDIQKKTENGIIDGHTHKLNTSRKPLLCVVRELRNVEFHISSVVLADEKRKFEWGHIDSPEEATTVNWTISWIDNLSIGNFEQLRFFSKNYHRGEFVRALSWFNDNQRKWGIVEVMFQAISIYAREIADRLAAAPISKAEVHG